MWIIDRYLLRQFLQTFIICFLCMAGLYVVFDAFTNLESFLRANEKNGGLVRLMLTHYGYQTIWFFDRTVGILTLTASMFTAAWIQRHQELTALMAAGISRVRVIAPVIAAVGTIILFGAVNREWLIPQFRAELARRPQDFAGEIAQELLPQYDEFSDIHIRGKACYADRQRIVAPVFRLPSSLDYYAKQITAQEAFYRPAEAGRPAGYLLCEVEQPKDLCKQPSLVVNEKPLVMTPQDHSDWLQPDQCFIASVVSFDQLTNGQSSRVFSSTRQLIAALHSRSVDSGSSLRVQIHSRIVQPLLDVTLLFLGLPLIVNRGNRNVFVALGMCGGLVAVFSLVVMACQHLGASYAINPVLGAWLPLMIFVPAAVELGHGMAQ